MGERSGPAARVDAALALLLAAGTAVYLAVLLRPVLGAADEGGYLYQAARVAAGDVLYRDVFNINPPGSYWLMAGLFRLFGTTLATARAASAVVSGLTAALAYLVCRGLGVRPALALAAGACQPALFQLAWPYASAHWLATALVVLLMLVLVRGPAPSGVGRCGVAGLVVGAVAAMQHHKAVVVAAAVGAILLGEELARRTVAPAAARAGIAARLAAFAGGVLAVAVPVTAIALARAGTGPVVDALVGQVVDYAGAFRSRWGEVSILNASEARYTFPALLRWLPVLLVPAVGDLAMHGRRGTPLAALRARLVLLLVPAAGVASILYFPDFIHIAIVGIGFAIVAAHLLERAARTLARAGRAGRLAPPVVVALLLLALAAQLERNRRRDVAEFAHPLATPFGRVYFRTAADAARVARIQRLVADEPEPRWLLSYPVYPALYLLTATRNPTRFVFVRPGYSGPAQLAEVIQAMERRRVPWAAVVRFLVPDGDPVLAYLQDRYVPVDGFDPAEGLLVLRRRG